MKKLWILGCLVLALSASMQAKNRVTQTSSVRPRGLYAVAFYNQENLFDTIHNEGKNDYEYLPTSKVKWNTEKYLAKLKNMSKVISELATDKVPEGAAIVGMAEVEDQLVLEDLLKQPALAERGYKYVHYEGPDKRGIDCALLYNPQIFQVDSSRLVPYVYPAEDTIHTTRGFLVVNGRLGGEDLTVIVNHWPSRGAESAARERAGVQVKALKEQLQAARPDLKIIVMGDMNDDPMDKSMTEALGCKHLMKEVGAQDLYNPWVCTLYEQDNGTLCYRGKWNLFDQIVFTGNLLHGNFSSLTYLRNEVFRRDYLIQQEGRYKGYPFRTQAGGVWMNGYSDHLPTIIYLLKTME
jgi:endonuclease/exonuclease/phosphatase family metal-dependent hydrolase